MAKRSQRKKLTPKEKKLLQGVLKGKTYKDAAIAAGYTSNYPRQAAAQAIESIKDKAPDLFARHGLDDDSFMDKYILPALNATEVKVFQHEGNIFYSEPLIAWTPRTTTNALVSRMKGMIKDTQPAQSTLDVKVVMVNATHRPAPKVIDVPTSD